MRAVGEGAAARLAAHYALVEVLASADTVEEASQRLLAIVGELFGWGVGALWLVDPAGETLDWVDEWINPAHDHGDWVRASRRLRFGRGEGLPGQVCGSGEPLWG